MDGGRYAAVVVAAGTGRRFGTGGPPKQYWDLLGEPVLLWALRPFLDHAAVSHVIAVLPPKDAAAPPEWLRNTDVECVAGGAQRSDSVRNGLAAVGAEVERVLIHDGARPLVSRALLDRVVDAGRPGAVIPVIPMPDTVKEIGPDQRVVRTVTRDRLWRVQTPQSFPRDTLRAVHDEAARAGYAPSDDAGIFERYGHPVHAVEGDPINIKVTTQTDLLFARALAHRLREGGAPALEGAPANGERRGG